MTIVSGDAGEAIVMLRAAVAVCPVASVTWAVKEKVPVAVGVPLISPVEPFSDKPGGSAPVVMLQE